MIITDSLPCGADNNDTQALCPPETFMHTDVAQNTLAEVEKLEDAKEAWGAGLTKNP